MTIALQTSPVKTHTKQAQTILILGGAVSFSQRTEHFLDKKSPQEVYGQ